MLYRCLALLLTTSIIVAAAALCLADRWLLICAHTLGDTTNEIVSLDNWQPYEADEITLARGDVIARIGAPNQQIISLEDLSESTQNAFLAAEDKNFWANNGIQPSAILRTAIQNLTIQHGHPAGASTVTQQLAKIMLMHGDDHSALYKGEQIVLALRIAETIPKKRVLELYLNNVFFGKSYTGLNGASHGWFGVSPANLSIAQAATLAGMIRNPSLYNPIQNRTLCLKRRNEVLDEMLTDGFIDPTTHDEAIATPLSTASSSEQSIEIFLPAGIEWITDLIRSELPHTDTGSPDLPPGLKIVLTVNPDLQTAATTALQFGLMNWEMHRHGWHGSLGYIALPYAITTSDQNLFANIKKRLTDANLEDQSLVPEWAKPAVILQMSATGLTVTDGIKIWRILPKGYSWIGNQPSSIFGYLKRGNIIYAGQPFGSTDGGALAEPTSLNGSVVIIDAATGGVMALTGGLRYTPGAFDRATSAMRPPGSTYKPFLYLAALDAGWLPTSPVFDIPIAIQDGNTVWQPQDDDLQWLGTIPLETALASSRNGAAVRLMWQLGPTRTGNVAKAFGIYDTIRSPATALGAQETTNLAMTSAYATLAADGIRRIPHLVSNPNLNNGIQVDSPTNIATLSSMLTDVFSGNGTASNLAPMLAPITNAGIAISGKTGTSTNADDAWIIGYAGPLTVGVQVGYDQPQSLGADAFGASVAGPIFANILTSAFSLGLIKPQNTLTPQGDTPTTPPPPGPSAP
jgi:penicillin-binding protein 1A